MRSLRHNRYAGARLSPRTSRQYAIEAVTDDPDLRHLSFRVDAMRLGLDHMKEMVAIK